ncbi:MAG: response regulator transcription factor [Anaerolineales bacterium]|nr:response regulator transcription factor [Anaerolineales bacterium]
MNLLDYLLHKLCLRKRRKTFARFDFQTRQAILELARQQNRPPEEVASQIMALGLEQHQLLQEKFQTWDQLTPRQKDVAALVCLGYTNQQIAERLKIFSETVKAQVSNIPHRGIVRHSEITENIFTAPQKRGT